MCLMVREPVHTQLSNSSFAEMTRSWPPFHLKTSLVPFSTVISCGAWGMAFQNPEVLTPITRSVGAAVSSVALVPRSEELLSAPATIAASISMIGEGAKALLQLASSHVICGNGTHGTLGQSQSCEGCAARSRLGSALVRAY